MPRCRMNVNGREENGEPVGAGVEKWRRRARFIVIQEAPGEEHYDSTRLLHMAALPVLNQSQRLQLMAKIRNNHRLPLIILN